MFSEGFSFCFFPPAASFGFLAHFSLQRVERIIFCGLGKKKNFSFYIPSRYEFLKREIERERERERFFVCVFFVDLKIAPSQVREGERESVCVCVCFFSFLFSHLTWWISSCGRSFVAFRKLSEVM